MTENVTQFLPRLQEPKHFHQRLRMMRTMRDLTQGQLAMAAEMDTGQVAHFEAGNRLPSFKNLRNLAIALHCTSDYLLGLSDGKYEDGYRRGAFDAVEAMKAATMPLRRGLALNGETGTQTDNSGTETVLSANAQDEVAHRPE